MFDNTRVSVEIFAPDMTQAISRPATARVSETEVEFDDVNFFDLTGDPFRVVRAQIDVSGTEIAYRTLESGIFTNVDDSGFNGYRIAFDALGAGAQVSLRNARATDATDTLGLAEGAVTVEGNALWINVDGLRFDAGDGFEIVLDLRFSGDASRDVFEGGSGRDLLLGRGGNDVLFGGAAADTIKGGGGSDLIDGGDGADLLVGGAGRDTFVLRGTSGQDRLRDFEAGRDRILVDDTADAFRDLTLRDVKAGVVVGSGDGRILLVGLSADDLDAGDFLF